jgi:hypothetical protein
MGSGLGFMFEEEPTVAVTLSAAKTPHRSKYQLPTEAFFI